MEPSKKIFPPCLLTFVSSSFRLYDEKMVRVETLQDLLIGAQLAATCLKGQSLLPSPVSPIMITHGSHYNRNYVCPKAHSKNGFILKAKSNGGHFFLHC
jgi:hypothetical protein